MSPRGRSARPGAGHPQGPAGACSHFRGVQSGRHQPRASASKDRSHSKLWDAGTGQERATLKGHTRACVNSVAFSPNGTILASGSGGSRERAAAGIRPSSSGTCAAARVRVTLTGHTNDVWPWRLARTARPSPSGNRGDTLKLWDIPTGQGALARLAREHAFPVICRGLQPGRQDPHPAASLGKTPDGFEVWLANPQTEARSSCAGRPGLAKVRHTQGTLSPCLATFSPDGKTLASAARTRTITIVGRPQSGQERATLKGNDGCRRLFPGFQSGRQDPGRGQSGQGQYG